MLATLQQVQQSQLHLGQQRPNQIMARTTGGGARRNTRRAAPSANELLNTFGKEIFGSDFKGAVTASSKGEFNKITDIMYDDMESMAHYDPQSYRNRAGLPGSSDPRFDPSGKTKSSRPFYEIGDPDEVIGLSSNLLIPGYEGPQGGEDTSAADITVVPTSTTNYRRPRTVAAGYDEDEEKLTVIFRDGTFYNYYEVDENEWKAFKANRSKGAIIAQMLDFKPRGEADASSMSAKAQQAYYRFSRGAQIHVKGAVNGQKGVAFKTEGQSKRTAKAAGKNPSKGGKAPKRK